MCEWRWTLFRIWDGYATPPFWDSCQCGSTSQNSYTKSANMLEELVSAAQISGGTTLHMSRSC
jgi:hypothetical protein